MYSIDSASTITSLDEIKSELGIIQAQSQPSSVEREKTLLKLNINGFDVYVGKQIPDGKKSIAYSATLRSKDGTLTDEQIERAVSKIMKKLDEIGAELRS